MCEESYQYPISFLKKTKVDHTRDNDNVPLDSGGKGLTMTNEAVKKRKMERHAATRRMSRQLFPPKN